MGTVFHTDESGWVLLSGLVDLLIKGMSSGRLFAVSRNQLTLGGAVPLWVHKGPKKSKHHKVQKIENVIKTLPPLTPGNY